MARLESGTMVVVADGEKALFMVNRGDADDPNLEIIRKGGDAAAVEREDTPSDRSHLERDPGEGRPAPVASDFHSFQKERFAADLADQLYRMAHAGRFERLVIVAAPTVLGVLRGAVHKEVADRIVAEIPKTLTNHPVPEIERLVSAALAESADG